MPAVLGLNRATSDRRWGDPVAGSNKLSPRKLRGPTTFQNGKFPWAATVLLRGAGGVLGSHVRGCLVRRGARRGRRWSRRSGMPRSSTSRARRAGDWGCGLRAIRRSWGGVRNGGQRASEASRSPVAYGLSGRDWQRWLMGMPPAAKTGERRRVGFVAGGRGSFVPLQRQILRPGFGDEQVPRVASVASQNCCK